MQAFRSLFLQPQLQSRLAKFPFQNFGLRRTQTFSYQIRDKHYLLHYQYVSDVLDKRPAYRPGHLDLIKDFHREGKLVMGGAYAEPVDGAVIVFSCDSEKEVEEFVSKDPYHENGLVTEYSIREWTVVPL